MAIVLAIEPDRRQAAHLAAIVQKQVGADLVIADTTEGALDAIGNRVPDLVLVPALLSPQDDAALAAALRVIAAAAHVRTLTIPVLANGTKKRAPAAGMLAKWRKNRPSSQEPDGCDPAVFGEQISTYLQEAAAERAQIAEDELLNAEDQLLHDQPMAAAPPIVIEPAAIASAPPPAMDYTSRDYAALQEDAAFAPAPHVEPPPAPVIYEQAWADSSDTWAAAPVQEPPAGPIEEPPSEPGEEPLIDLSEELEGLAEEADAERYDGEAVGVYTISAGADDPIEALDLMPAILEPPSALTPATAAPERPVAAAAIEPKAPISGPLFTDEMFVESLFADDTPTTLVLEKPVFSEALLFEPAEPPRADIDRWAPMYLTPGRIWPALEGVPIETPVARTEQPDWIELVASLRQDLERRRTDHSTAPPPPVAARPSDGASANPLRLVKKPRPAAATPPAAVAATAATAPATAARKMKPLQDEWGFFDPERCGFSTLLAKLEEITEEDARP